MTIWAIIPRCALDFYNAKIDTPRANEVIGDDKWLKDEFTGSYNSAAPQ
jgi:hypothetical protein